MLETAALTEQELAEAAGRQAQATKADRHHIKELERELRRKDTALAETAALLVLRKKPRRSEGTRKNDQCSRSLPNRHVGQREALAASARLRSICAELGIGQNTYRRWSAGGSDRRPSSGQSTPVRGQFFYLYLVIDSYSRKIVGHEVFNVENMANSTTVVQHAVLREQCRHEPLVLHTDSGPAMMGQPCM